MGDWFNLDMIKYMQQVLSTENCPYALRSLDSTMETIVLFYGPDNRADEIESFLMQ
jgi:hypothetical protein